VFVSCKGNSEGVRLKGHIGILLLFSSVFVNALALAPTVSIQVTTPQRYSFSLGLTGVDWGRVFGTHSGFLVRAEPGLSGGKLHIGFRSALSLILMPVASADVTAAILRTWNDPWGGIESNQTYGGLELRIGMRLVTATVGVYRHMAGEDTEHEWITSLGAGFGL